ncbi:hypothetical protein [Streptomyces sp. 8N616]|uniref:hypothetical protein n=1 Tax=Streptomyces sp. 8N616 TaxID=3457414 RepID=UPI003FD6BC7F
MVVERSGYSLHWIPRLRTAFPYARFVHLFRDGPDCAVSMSRHVGYRTISLLREIRERSGVESLTDLTPQHVRELPPDLAALLGDRFDSRLVLDRPMPLTRFGHLWSGLIIEGMTYLEQVPAQMRTTLAYEDLVAEPDGELSRLADFIGVAAVPDWLEAGRTMLDGGKRGASLRLPPDELSALRERCAPGMSVLHGV